MSEWSVPQGMTPQDNPGQPKDGVGALIKMVRDNATEMRDRFNNLLKQAGIRVEPDLVRFTGAVRIEGTLSLPAGIIDNDALASPVTFAGNAGNLTSTPPPLSWATACTANLTVPDWAGQGVVMATGSIAGTTGAVDGASIMGRIVIAGDGGVVEARYIRVSDSDTIPVMHQFTFDPAGTTVNVTLQWMASDTMIGGAAQLVAIGVFGR